MAKGSDQAPVSPISPEDQARIRKSARQVAAYANFLRWSANFRKDEIIRHPNHDRIAMLSPMQSGRFSFGVSESTLFLGVQDFEAAWFASMPFEAAYISDRLYLSVEGVACMDSKMPPLALGLFVDEAKKRKLMSSAKFIQAVRVWVEAGAVVEVGDYLGEPIPIHEGSIVTQLFDTQQEKLRQKDMSRYF
uniref:hypothetical protein n=1 Tax=Pseudomonas syringae TaxID=317 RepID=UPI001E3F4199|nr:hypothetical protein [Pseudomonas syringae]QOQ33386.1 hypothetical protein [Pseudomonas syringae pv. actinidiae]